MEVSLKQYFTAFILTLFLFSCTKDRTDDTIVLKNVIATYTDCTCEPFINQYLWKSKKVYVLAFKGPTCDWRPSYFDGNGVEFNMDKDYTFDKFLEESSFLKNIWTCQE